jgi:hypothetical protein
MKDQEIAAERDFCKRQMVGLKAYTSLYRSTGFENEIWP